MRQRRLGLTDLHVTEIGRGTNAVVGHNLYDGVANQTGIDFVRRAVDLGVNFLDTADVYGLGRSEELIGEALRDVPPAQVLIATKGANRWDEASGKRLSVSNHPDYLRAALERSLRRLGRDYVDLYYIHRIDPDVPLCYSFGALMDLKRAGKIRAAGLSNVTVAQIQAAMCAGRVDAVQNQYSLLQRDAEADVLPFCEDNDIAFIPYGPLAFGILGGKYNAKFALTPNDWRRGVPMFGRDNFPRALKIARQVADLAAKRGVTPGQVAIRWTLRWRNVASVIAGAKNSAQVDENVGAADWCLTDDEIDQLNDLTAGVHFEAAD